MTYKKIEGENDREREQRWLREYDDYAKQCANDGHESLNFMNWLSSKKYQESLP